MRIISVRLFHSRSLSLSLSAHHSSLSHSRTPVRVLDYVGIEWPRAMGGRDKALLLGAVFLIDFMYFEDNDMNSTSRQRRGGGRGRGGGGGFGAGFGAGMF